jgi:hypothetical protein
LLLFLVTFLCCRQVFTGRYEFVSREQEAALLQDISLQVRLPLVCAQHSTVRCTWRHLPLALSRHML